MSAESSNQANNQALDLKKIENEDERLISFSKRRESIYKKASEISVLCGAEAGVMIFSPSGKPFTYGFPNIGTIVNRFRGRSNAQLPDNNNNNNNNSNNMGGLFDASRNANLEKLNHDINELSSRLFILKKDGEILSKAKDPIYEEFWFDACLEELNEEQIEQLAESMEQLKKVSGKRVDEILALSNVSDSGNAFMPSRASVFQTRFGFEEDE